MHCSCIGVCQIRPEIWPKPNLAEFGKMAEFGFAEAEAEIRCNPINCTGYLGLITRDKKTLNKSWCPGYLCQLEIT